MSILLSILNDGAVSIFGSVLSASFCNALDNRRKRGIFWTGMVITLLLQGWIYYIGDAGLLRRIFPLIVHLPLEILLYALTGRVLWSVISVFSAYLCCQLRRWLALLVVALFSGGDMMQDAVELAVTLPILLLLLYFVTPAIRQLADRPAKFQLWFGVIPALYYVFDYATAVYTDALSSGKPVVTEFMPLVCCVGYLVFLLYYSAQEQRRSHLKQVQDNLALQLKQSVREITTLRESQTLAQRYRHDLRHHLQYLSACIENGRKEQAQEYIADICREIEAQKVKRYCENETVNLIFSSFDGRAAKEGIRMNITGTLSETLNVSERDLCVLLSNALENAIQACSPAVAAGEACTIDVQLHEKAGRVFLSVTNPCRGEVCFERGIPVSKRQGHGIGMQSICAIVEKYKGVYSFRVKDGSFILRLYL